MMPILAVARMADGRFCGALGLPRRHPVLAPTTAPSCRQYSTKRAFWSHYGRLCPYDTPSSVDVGVTLSLAAGARINEDGFIETPCHPVANGKVKDDEVHWLSPWEPSAFASTSESGLQTRIGALADDGALELS